MVYPYDGILCSWIPFENISKICKFFKKGCKMAWKLWCACLYIYQHISWNTQRAISLVCPEGKSARCLGERAVKEYHFLLYHLVQKWSFKECLVKEKSIICIYILKSLTWHSECYNISYIFWNILQKIRYFSYIKMKVYDSS